MPIPAFPHNACFALLDDASASASSPASRLYSGHCGSLSCHAIDGFAVMLEEMRGALTRGLYAVGVFGYELGEHLQGLAAEDSGQSDALATVLLFEKCEHLSADQVTAWLALQASNGTTASQPAHAGVAGIRSSISETAFNEAIATIHAYIEAGDTYQVNFTYRMRFDAFGAPAALYARLRERQPVPYGALIALPNGRTVLSLSPELFVRHENGLLTACPMKGTAPATGDASLDATYADALASDPKNRAENVMIVDLLRNDLGRIAELGSVQVPELFRVKRHGRVLQMTSTITAQARPDIGLAELFAAIYPCGSITGAPKHRTMQIIAELEASPRALYTGAIGWFDPHDAACPMGDFCMSVPIRTLVLEAENSAGIRAGEMGIGAGIVHDSDAGSEYAECRLKANFLTGLPPDFALFETMHATREEGCRNLDLHLQRLAASAAYFGFRYDENDLRGALRDACAALAAQGPHRMRLSLRHTGEWDISTGTLAPTPLPVKLLLANEPTDEKDIFLRHKTTARERYDAAWRAAEAQGAFDMLFFNLQGELTEGARSNVFVKLQGRWYTPPLSSGLLPGVMRALVLGDPAWSASERCLALEDLRQAEDIAVCNALRGVLPAAVTWLDEKGG